MGREKGGERKPGAALLRGEQAPHCPLFRSFGALAASPYSLQTLPPSFGVGSLMFFQVKVAPGEQHKPARQHRAAEQLSASKACEQTHAEPGLQ